MTGNTSKTSGKAIPGRVRAVGSAKVPASKHRAVKREYNGMTFDSGRELKRWQELEVLRDAGVIRDLKRQVSYVLAKSVKLNGRTKPAIRYVADFVYWLVGEFRYVVEDAKSPHLRNNPVFRIKMHLLKLEHGIEVTLV